ncbi:DUF4331 family protein [Tamlana sp. s12]|uniref:DUF4331 family protein n=1 Tax=Tamlana sp. s12 TaxID=1630406 RepID=UPI0007FFAA56|nr:DUF4331 family protein [Tamlana sp. s12]OBQ54625.1 molecular chaperone DnaK [Tamlana sp. s12]QQY82117.1 DUF4331 family protein [Tamlana sp. s12]
MKNLKVVLGIGVIAIAGFFIIAADHIDAPAVQGGNSDITDFYAFQGENTDNLVFVANLQGLLSPAMTDTAMFDENVLVEFNIDTNNDFVEDLVIQAIPKDGKMWFFGPVAPSQTGLKSTIQTNAITGGVVDISAYGSSPKITSNAGMSFFAGPRDDPFFMDFAQYSEIIAGNASSFNTPGADTFAGTNVMSIVVEVPKAMIGNMGSINTWVGSKRK